MSADVCLEWLLRVAGAGLLLLFLLHAPIARELKWKEEGKRLSVMNESVFHVHTFFICLVLVMMGLPSLLQPAAFLEKNAMVRWTTVSWSAFWWIRLYCQWFVYKPETWKGKPKETAIHYIFSIFWVALGSVYGWAAWRQFTGA